MKTVKRTNEELIKELESKNNLIESIYNLLEVITQTTDLDIIYDKILESAIYTIEPASFGSLLVLDEEGYYRFACLYGFDKEKFGNMKLKPHETSMYKETGGLMDRSIIVEEILRYNSDFIDEDIVVRIEKASVIDIKTTLSVPIRYNDEVIAILNLDSLKENAFDNTDMKNLELFAMETSNFIKIKNLMNKQEYLNNHDSLTGVYNRRHFRKNMKNMLEKGEAFQMAFIDLDDLKMINDNYGHMFGDSYIKEFALTANEVVDKYGVFSRFGGDEFNIVTTYDADEIIKEIKNELRGKFNKIDIEFSHGVACYPDDGKDYDDLFKVADKRMYKNKSIKKDIL